MIIGRIIGWLLVLAALVVLVSDLIGWLDTGHIGAVAAGQLWFEISPTTLELAQPAIQRHVAAWLWDPIVVILSLPAALVLGAPGLLLLWAFRNRDRRRRRR
jgi:hypothetical protein